MDRGQPADVRTHYQSVLSLDPSQVVDVLLVAIVNGLMARALGVHVHHSVDQASGPEPRRERNVAQRRLRPGKIQFRCGDARTNDVEVLAAANPADMDAINEVVPDLPVEPCGKAIAANVRGADRGGVPPDEANLAGLTGGIGCEVAATDVAAEEFNFVRKVMVQAEVHEVVFKRLRDAGTETLGVRAVANVRVVAQWHQVPQLLHGGAYAYAARIAGLVTCGAAQHGSGQIVLNTTKGENPITQGLRRHDAFDLHSLRKTPYFVVCKEEGLVFPYWTADAGADAIVMLRLLRREIETGAVGSVAIIPSVGV